MDVLRIGAAAVLAFAGMIIGRATSGKLELRKKALEDFLSFVRQLEVLIRASGRTIPDALLDCSRRLEGRWTGKLAAALAELYGAKAEAAGLWLRALREARKTNEEAASLTPEDCQAVSLFGDQLASSDLKSIAENYAFLYSRLEESLRQAERDKTVKGKLFNTIGILAGLAAAIAVI